MAIDRDGNYIFVFDAEIPGSEDYSALGDIEDVSDYDAAFFLTFETGTIHYTHVLHNYADWGQLISVYAPILNSNGDIVGVVGVDFDGNDIHEAITSGFTQLIILAGVLAAIGIILFFLLMRDLGFMTQRLETALKESNAASLAKSNFLSNMSHEMRTPMNAIIGMTTIGKRAGEVGDKNDALDKIGTASTHLLGVINDILDMSKIEAGKMDLLFGEFDLENVIKRLISVLQSRSDEKNQTLSVNIDENVPRHFIGDDQRLAQVLANLISNSVKFTPEGGSVTLNISVVEESDDFCELRFEVVDTGIGISPEKQGKLFDAFEQAEDVTTRIYGGTGLGLAITKNIIEMMEGNIWIESELGKGAKFIFTIKLEKNDVSEDDLSDSGSDSDNILPLSGEYEGKHLLLAEDIAINREILLSLLEGSGLLIDCAENGMEAVSMVSANPEKYDIVFMDLQMPEMGGLEATRNIRALPERKRERLPIVAMTANVFKEDIDACIEAGMDDHLGKPLEIDKVYSKLKKYVK
jgi:signal transduction histidine kinase/CheY-like chemotaxis protein